jgi:predicted metal-dependent peptidase
MTKADLDKAFFLARKAAPYGIKALAAVRVVWTKKVVSNGAPTMACDKYWRVYIHPDLQVSAEEAAWILLHEVLGHLVREHHAQCAKAGAEPGLANLAMDCEIESWEWPSLKRPSWGVTPAKFGLPTGKLWGWYYDKISGQAQDKEGDGEGDGGDGEGDKQASSHTSSAADGMPRDYELAPDDKQAQALDPTIAKALTKDVAEEIKRAGNVPAGLQVWADAVLAPPKRNWRNVLRQFLSQNVKRGMQDKNGSFKVHRVSGLLTPSWTDSTPSVAVVADTSGSMSSVGGKVLTEVVGIIGASATTDIVWCDTVPVVQRNVRRHTLKPVGGGGTDLRPAIAKAQELGRDAIIIITDCDTPWPAKPIKNALVVCVGNGQIPSGWKGVKI